MLSPSHHRSLFVSLIVGALLATAFLGTSAAQDSTLVTIRTALDPAHITVEVGTSVTWTNADGERHRMRWQTGPAGFDTGNLDPGTSATITFSETGTYTYLDHRNPDDHELHGTVVVVEAGTGPSPDPGGEPPAPTPPPPTSATVSMAGRVFRPATLNVSVGGTVTFLNDDDRAHTATANDRSWDTGIFDSGGGVQQTFTEPGSYAYFCVIHPDMTGTIVVGANPGDPSPPSPPTTVAPTPPTTAPSTTTAPPSEPSDPTPTPPRRGEVEILDFAFGPQRIELEAGGTVQWHNTGAAPHTATSVTGLFDSGFMFTGDTYTTTFDSPGTYDYYCTLHPEMTATVSVAAASGPTAPSGDSPPPSTTTSVPTDAGPGETADTSTGSGSSPRGFDVAMLDNRFGPASITVRAGSAVVWSNNGEALHTVTAVDGSFDSGFTAPGETFSAAFSSPGTYDYLCIIHPGMTGTVLVTDSAGSTPPPATVPEPGSDITDTPPTSADLRVETEPGTAGVDMIDLDYEPRDLVVVPGTEVLWLNTGAAPHTVTAVDESFDSGVVMPGDTFSRRFDEAGTYAYLCTLHPGMEGTVTVSLDAVASASTIDGPPTAATAVAADDTTGLPALGSIAGAGTGMGTADIAAIIFAVAVLAVGWTGAIWLVPGATRRAP